MSSTRASSHSSRSSLIAASVNGMLAPDVKALLLDLGYDLKEFTKKPGSNMKRFLLELMNKLSCTVDELRAQSLSAQVDTVSTTKFGPPDGAIHFLQHERSNEESDEMDVDDEGAAVSASSGSASASASGKDTKSEKVHVPASASESPAPRARRSTAGQRDLGPYADTSDDAFVNVLGDLGLAFKDDAYNSPPPPHGFAHIPPPVTDGELEYMIAEMDKALPAIKASVQSKCKYAAIRAARAIRSGELKVEKDVKEYFLADPGYVRSHQTVADKLNAAVVAAGRRAVGVDKAGASYKFKPSTWKLLEKLVAEEQSAMFTSAQTAKSSPQDMAAKSKADKATAIELAAEQRKKEEQELEAEKKKLAQQQATVDNLLGLAQQFAQRELQPAAGGAASAKKLPPITSKFPSIREFLSQPEIGAAEFAPQFEEAGVWLEDLPTYSKEDVMMIGLPIGPAKRVVKCASMYSDS